jgi:hypothetical protein
MPDLHDSSPRRVMAPSVAAAEPDHTDKVFTRSPRTRARPRRYLQEENDAHGRYRYRRQSMKLSLGNTLAQLGGAPTTTAMKAYLVTQDLSTTTSKGRGQARAFHHYTPCLPHNKKVKPPPPPQSMQESQLCSPPSRASAPASMSRNTANHPHLNTTIPVGRVEDTSIHS